jgi:hypothetical protein
MCLSPVKVVRESYGVWSSEQIAWWHARQKDYLLDRTEVEQDQAIDLQRAQIRQEILQVLNSFLEGSIGLKAFNATFQQRTHGNWSAFHLRGMSGGLFFNQLVQRVPNEETFAHLLRLIIQVPEERREAQQRMQAFVRFLEELISSQQVRRAQLQPARVPFFQSIWWHVQAQERWPIFYVDIRRALAVESSSAAPAPDPTETYLTFCTRFLALAQALRLSAWELEHLCRWSVQHSLSPDAAHDEKQYPSASLSNTSSSPVKQSCVPIKRAKVERKQSLVEKVREAIVCRTQVQWFLAQLGRKVGCQIWISASDHDKSCNNELLGDLSLPSLPILVDSAFQRVIGKIDVLWFQGQEVIAAFEIEKGWIDVSMSLLRLADLKELFPDRHMNLCLVVMQERFEKAWFELSRPAFQARDMQSHCALISEELLLEQEEHILRWATSPAVIDGLIRHGKERKP